MLVEVEVGATSSITSSGIALRNSASRRITSSARLRAVVVSHAAGLAGMPSLGPAGQRARVRVLHALLGEIEIARDPHRRGEDEAPLATVRVGDRRRDGCAGGRALS